MGIDINSTGEEGSLACSKTMLGVFCLKHCEIYENHMVLSYFEFNGRLKRMRIVLGRGHTETASHRLSPSSLSRFSDDEVSTPMSTIMYSHFIYNSALFLISATRWLPKGYHRSILRSGVCAHPRAHSESRWKDCRFPALSR